MKSNELRIGNLIYNPVQKINIVADGGLIAMESMREKAVKDYKGFEPIPLTEEWLVKFGFEGVDYTCPENGFITKNESFELEIDTYSRIIVESDFSFGIESLDRKSDVIFKNDILDSVHRLQNLYFALTGQELEITTQQK